MILLIVTIALQSTPCIMDCVEKKDAHAVEALLAKDGKKLQDFDYQLSTNHAFIYKLEGGQVVLIPSVPYSSAPTCLVFNDQKCFDHFVTYDYFPIENYAKRLEDHDVQSIKTIHTKILYFQEHLNRRYGLNLIGLNRETAEQYYSKVLKDKSADPVTIVALGAVMGEILRVESNGKWVLRKVYGSYNPYYEPMILFGDKLVKVNEKLTFMLEARNKSSLFFESQSHVVPKAVYDKAGVKLLDPTH